MTILPAAPYQINPEYLRPGDVTLTWCRVHMDRTEHLYQPAAKVKLVCLECRRDLDPRISDNEKRESHEQK